MKPLTPNNTLLTTDRDDGLPDAVAERLLLDIAPQEPPADVAQRVRARVMQRLQTLAGDRSEKQPTDAPHASVTVSVTDKRPDLFINIVYADGWVPLAGHEDVAEMKVLHDDGITLSWLGRLKPGGRIQAHGHDGAEECLVLSGTLWLNDTLLRAGDYQVALPGTEHAKIYSDDGCVVFVRSPSPQRGRAMHAMTA